MAGKRPRFPTPQLPQSSKFYWALAIAALCPLTLWGTTQSFNGTMMLLTTFVLAYLGKGIRKTKPW
ncbi:MAG: hypothetical protein ACO36E_11635 [Synechocystis sp.]